MWDQVRSGVIQGVKGGLDIWVAFERFAASEAKLKADVLEAGKNMADRSANAMSESGRKATEDVKNLLQRMDSALQILHASAQKATSA
jgi:hypothetical protein